MRWSTGIKLLARQAVPRKSPIRLAIVTMLQHVATKVIRPPECREHDYRAAALSAVDQKIIANMRARVEMCRRLADSTHDERTAKILRQMADEGDADIRRLEAEAAANERPEDPRP